MKLIGLRMLIKVVIKMNDEPEKKEEGSDESLSEMFLNFMKKQKEKKVEESQETPQEKSGPSKVRLHNDKFWHSLQMMVNVINERIEKLLMSDRQVRWLSLLLTIIIFFVVNGGDISSAFRSNKSVSYFNDVPLVVENLPDEYEVSGVPNKVNIIAIGSSFELTNLKLLNNIQVYIDLSNLSEGRHTVEVKTRNIPDSIEALLQPDTIEINIMPKITETFSLSYEFVNENQMDSMYVLGIPELDMNEVKIYASEATLDKINRVVAQIDVKGIKTSFEKEATIVAYDYNGNILDVEVIPETVKVRCEVTSDSKEVPIRVATTGQLSEGYAISNIQTSQTATMIYGKKEVLDQIDEILVTVDINDLKESQSIKSFNLVRPAGVVKSTINVIDIDVIIEPSMTKEFKDLPIQWINNDHHYLVNVSDEDRQVTLRIEGATSLIEALKNDDIRVVGDLKDATLDTQTLTLMVQLDSEWLTYEFVTPSEISVTLEESTNG